MTDTRKAMTDEEIKKEKPLLADFASFRAGIRCAERLYLARIAELEAALAQQVEQQEPDTRTDDGGCTSPVERQIIQTQITKDISTAQPDDAIIRAWQAGYYHAGYTNDQAYADKMAREYAGAAPAAQPQCDNPNACAHPFCSCGGSDVANA